MEAAHAGDLQSLEGALIRFAQRRDFATVSAVVVLDQPAGDAEFISIGNFPDGFENVHRDASASRRDPLLQTLKHQTVPLPIFWDQRTYTVAGAGDLWEEQAAWGYRSGIILAMHLAHGRHFLLGVDGPDDMPEAVDARTQLVAELQLMAVYSQDSALRLLQAPDLREPAPALTMRERDVLAWTLEDKSAWVVGRLLNISEHTVAFHLKNAMKKLGCATKHSAAAKAARLGLIKPLSR